MEKRKLFVIISIFVTLFLLIGGTFAWLTWSSENTLVQFIPGSGFSCSADGGGDITSDEGISLVPSSCSNANHTIKREIATSVNIDSTRPELTSVYMDLWLTVDSIGSYLVNNENFKYVVTTSSTSCTTGIVAQGDFGEIGEKSQIQILSGQQLSEGSTPFYLYIWLDSSETEIPPSNESDRSFSLSIGGSCADETSVITVATLVAAANPTTLTYESATDEQKANMWAVEHEATSQTPATTDYRYIGASPNNWIKFNGDEYWRIIGVFDGKIKIISNSKIGGTNYYFDYKQTGVGSSTSSYGSNDWTDAQLMYMLNAPIYKNTDGTYNTTLLTSELLKTGYTIDENNYIKDTASNIIYQLGKEPASIATGATSYSGTDATWSLTTEAINQIEKSTFYLGGTSSYSNSASAWYNAERGITTPNSNTNPTNWTGYVGLMYPSDYAYTYAYGVDDTCFNNPFNCTATLGAKSWLYQDVIANSYHPWTISPKSSDAYSIFNVLNVTASVNSSSVRGTLGVHSSIYLKSNIELKGKGTYDEPYEIVG